MKKFLLLAVFCSLAFVSFSQFVCPSFFKRNNGNGHGCDANITLNYGICPTSAQIVVGLLDGGVNGTIIPGLTFSQGTCINGQVDVCIMGSNIPPASTLTIRFSNQDGTVIGTCDGPSGGPTPILLSSFSVQRIGSNVKTNWQTQQEINSKNFEVQRAYDNASYQTIATIPAHGNSSTIQSYSFTDNTNNSNGTSFYRIKFVDVDGSFRYTDIKSIKGYGIKSGAVIFPNPAFGNAKITITDLNETTKVELLDNSGRLVKSATLSNANTVELNGLKKGTYMVRIIGTVSGNSEVKKLTVIN
ncbi:MAG: T9SS type A sorting domain-containing protein [Ginsengibacter sp.]